MTRTKYGEAHEQYRTRFREFLRQEVVPHQPRWIDQGCVDRDAWRKAGAGGFLCPWLPPDLGGVGGDFHHACVINEELAAIYETGFAIKLHSDVVAPLIFAHGSDAQKRRWLPRCAAGEVVLAFALTEPGAGSDLGAISTAARLDGDAYVVDGVKTYISTGMLFDLCLVAVRTGSGAALSSLSLLLVEGDAVGLRRRKLDKIGMWSLDTAELTFEGCRVPVGHRLGEEGEGFRMLMKQLPRERLIEAISAQASAEQVFRDTIDHVRRRVLFGQPQGKLQNTQFRLAECAAQIEVGRAFIDRLVAGHAAASSRECAIAKLWTTQMLSTVVDVCLQQLGGAGYLAASPIGRAYVDARARHLAAGTDEVLKAIIAHELRL